MRRRFFVEDFSDATAVLRGEAADHLGRVLRAELGQLYELSDGRRVWLAKIERVALAKRGQSRIEFALIEPVPASEPALRINLLISLVKFDRFEWCLEKATELGANEIVPLAAARTDKPLIAAAAKRHERWQKILLESAQQSRRLRPPVLHEIGTPEQAFRKYSRGLKILLSERPEAASLSLILAAPSGGRALGSNMGVVTPAGGAHPGERDQVSVALATGPEGGWADEEIRAATESGFAEASLGKNILRTETAVLASLSILAFAFEPGDAAAE
jgi:16S rRNA (uracil1498-N3)-methyltransferase